MKGRGKNCDNKRVKSAADAAAETAKTYEIEQALALQRERCLQKQHQAKEIEEEQKPVRVMKARGLIYDEVKDRYFKKNLTSSVIIHTGSSSGDTVYNILPPKALIDMISSRERNMTYFSMLPVLCRFPPLSLLLYYFSRITWTKTHSTTF